MKYLDLYKEYIVKIDQLRLELGKKISVKEEKNQSKILFIKDDIRKVKNIFIISMAIFMVLLGPVYSILKDYDKIKYLWYYLLFVIIVCMVFSGIYIYFLNEMKKVKVIDNNEEENKVLINEYQLACEEIYKITLYIICMNEYYYDLINLKGKELDEKWNEIVLSRKEAINSSMNYQINVEKYINYLENWIKNTK